MSVFNYRISNAMNLYGESGGITPPYLTSASDGYERSPSCFGRFASGKSVQYPINRKLCGYQSKSGPCKAEKISYPIRE